MITRYAAYDEWRLLRPIAIQVVEQKIVRPTPTGKITVPAYGIKHPTAVHE